MDERWYEHAVVYEVSLRTFADADGDGTGDLRGLTARLDYLARLGVTCLWLLPFYPSPWRDGGYDVTDYYGVHPDFGTLGEFVELIHRAGDRGIRVIVDMVLNHTSDQHPWFEAARRGHPRYRDFYIWSKERPADADSGIVFPGYQRSTWSRDEVSGEWYFHRFFDFQPDLNVANPEVRDEMRRIMGFWLELGVAGFRLDALPFLIEAAGAHGTHPGPEFEYLHEFRNFVSWRRGDVVLLGEANVPRKELGSYFGVGGMHMLFDFLLNQHLWLAMARQEWEPLARGLEETAGIPETDQWGMFLRNHDELDLGRLSDGEREEVFEAFGPKPDMQLYDRGIRRRLAPMLDGDRRRIEMAFSLLFTLPGTPVIYYGDEIGMGDDLSLPQRDAVRLPMQWSPERNAGFSRAEADRLVVPVNDDRRFGHRAVNVADQRRDPASLLSWMERLILVRRECPEFGTGSFSVVRTGNRRVFAIRSDAATGTVVAVHNLSGERQEVSLDLGRDGEGDGRDGEDDAEGDRGRLVELFGDRDGRPVDPSGFSLQGYGYRWFRLGPEV